MKFYKDSTSVHSCFFPLTLLSCFFFYKGKGLLVSGLWSRQGTFLRGAQAPFLDTSQCCTSFPPPSLGSLSPTTSAPLSPIAQLFSLTFSDSATSYLSVPTIPSSPVMPASVPLTQTHPGALISPLCHLSLPLLAFSITLLGFCLFGKTVESLTFCRCLWFLPGSRGAQGESALCSDNVGLQGGSWDCFSAQRFLAGVF